MLELLEAFWTDVLLLQNEQPARHLPECAPHAERLASTLPQHDALRRVQAIAGMRGHLGMGGVNEPLALEHGILNAFGPAPAS